MSKDWSAKLVHPRSRTPHQVCTKHAIQYILTSRQTSEKLAGREGRVQEQPDGCIGELLAQHLWHKQKVIILNPNLQKALSILERHEIEAKLTKSPSWYSSDNLFAYATFAA